jgi:hypothetical protein
MEVSVNLQQHDTYEPVRVGLQPGVSMLFVSGHLAPNEVAIIGSPREFRRLARALTEAAAPPPLGPRPSGNGEPRP